MDATGSMQPSIDEVKTKAINLVRQIKATNPLLTLRAGFVGYRDPLEPRGGEHDVFDFVQLHAQDGGADHFKSNVMSVKAYGGGDGCEDVAGGLSAVLGLKWSEGSTKVLFHVLDAPCHGAEFHDGGSDHHASGDHGMQELLFRLKRLGVDYYLAPLNTSTDKMHRRFNEICALPVAPGEPTDEFVKKVPLDSPAELISSVAKSVRDSVSLRKETLASKSKTKPPRGLYTDTKKSSSRESLGLPVVLS